MYIAKIESLQTLNCLAIHIFPPLGGSKLLNVTYSDTTPPIVAPTKGAARWTRCMTNKMIHSNVFFGGIG